MLGLFILACFIPALIEASSKPNVIIIFADDVGTGDVPGYWEGAGAVNMPNLENLVAEGTTFTDAHSTPICAPSRYVLLSGNYQHRGVKHRGTWSFNYETSNFWEGQQSIAEVLRDNGYNCGVFGKWHLGGKVATKNGFTPPDWRIENHRRMISNENHDWTKPIIKGPSRLGFDTSYVTMQGIQRPPFIFFRNDLMDVPDLYNFTDSVQYWRRGTTTSPTGMNKILGRGGEGSVHWDTSAFNMIIVNETEKFIDDHFSNSETSDKPFFAYLPLGAAHKPHSPPNHFMDGTPVAGEYPNDHMDILSELDLVVGSVVGILEERNIVQDTIIIFTTDNGGITRANSHEHGHYTSGPLKNGKGSIYEGGHRVPLSIRWDNGSLPKGQKRSHHVGLNDVFATICDLVGVSVPSNQAIDSVSFADYIFDETATANLRTNLGVWNFEERLMQSSIRKGNLKLIHDYQTNVMELYDLDADVGETRNIYDENKGVGWEMFLELKSFGPCYDNPNRFMVGTKMRKCRWYRLRPKRCYEDVEAIYNCRRTCAVLKDRNSCRKLSQESLGKM